MASWIPDKIQLGDLRHISPDGVKGNAAVSPSCPDWATIIHHTKLSFHWNHSSFPFADLCIPAAQSVFIHHLQAGVGVGAQMSKTHRRRQCPLQRGRPKPSKLDPTPEPGSPRRWATELPKSRLKVLSPDKTLRDKSTRLASRLSNLGAKEKLTPLKRKRVLKKKINFCCHAALWINYSHERNSPDDRQLEPVVAQGPPPSRASPSPPS